MYKFIIIIVSVFLLVSCKRDEETIERQNNHNGSNLIPVNDCLDHIQENKQENLNISILLDLSDRIELPNQQAYDSANISSLASIFNTHIKKKRLGLLYDKMQIFLDPTPLDQGIDNSIAALKISYVKGVSKDVWMPKTKSLYDSIPSQIYDLVREGANKNGYPGSDIWSFFKNHVEDYAIEDCRRNVLVILTDGYMYHDESKMENENRTSFITPQRVRKLQLNSPNWKEDLEKRNLGFIPANQDLNDLEVLVIGITNQNKENPYTSDIIKAYWSNWFDDMGVKKYKIKNADIPTHMEKVISDFILNK